MVNATGRSAFMALRWGISGTGDIVQKAVAPAIWYLPEAALHSVYSRTFGRAEALGRRFGASHWTASFNDFLADDELDAVYVGGEVDRHAPETIAAAEAGRHVVVEKPMATDVGQCRRMVDACRANGVHLAVAYYRRYYPQVLKLKELIDAGALGTPLHVAVDMAADYNPPADDHKRWRVWGGGGGGALMDIGSHRLDVLCLLFGEPRWVAGLAANRVHPYPSPDTESVLVEFASGLHLLLRCTWCAGARQDTLEIIGSEAAILAGALEDERFIIRRTGRPDEVVTVAAHSRNRHLPLLADVTERLLAGQPPRHDGLAGMQASRIMSGCYTSLASRRVVEV